MKTSRLLAGVMALTLFTACDDSPIEPAGVNPQLDNAAHRSVFEHLYEYTGDSDFVFGCAADGTVLDNEEGERVTIFGGVFERITYMQNSQNDWHVKYQVMPVNLRGIGRDTGEEFRVDDRENSVFGQNSSGSTGNYKYTLKFKGSSGRTFWQVYKGNYRLNAEGDVVVERETVQTVCRV